MGNHLDLFKGLVSLKSDSEKKEEIQDEFQQELEDGPYVAKLQRSMFDIVGFPRGATKIYDFLYLGAEPEATNLRILKDIGITHVINCAEGYIHTGPSFYGSSIKYMGFEGEDDDSYDIMQHFDQVYNVIEEARTSGGKVFIHCIMGINRSGALTVAYCMLYKNMGPLAAARYVKRSRRILLTNESFQRQLIRFARQKNLLHHDDAEVKG